MDTDLLAMFTQQQILNIMIGFDFNQVDTK